MKLVNLLSALWPILIMSAYAVATDSNARRLWMVITKYMVPINSTTAALEESMVQDRFSILEAMSLENQNLIKKSPISANAGAVPRSELKRERVVCQGDIRNPKTRNQDMQMKMRIKTSIESVLRFYGSHLDNLNRTDYAVGLAILKAVDDKHGSSFQSNFPVESWMRDICTRAENHEGTVICEGVTRVLMARTQHWNKWQDAYLLNKSQPMSAVGHEKETLFPSLHFDCTVSLLQHCQVPHVCERVMFDPQPRSQYMLTHQVLQRILAETKMKSCGLAERLLNKSVSRNLNGKMFKEAKLLADYGVPFIFRDLFAEYVFFGGYMGYPNFFRTDWLDTILSWQSKSNYGCFLKEDGSNFALADTELPRRLTEKEIYAGKKSITETCQAHFTSVGLAALAVAWDFMEDNCAN